MGKTVTQESLSGIAVVGYSCRFPGARNADEFWRNLRDGIETISRFSDEELLAAGVDPQTLNNPNYVKARGVLHEPEMFDAAFFGINATEAVVLDPQQRLFLECAWETLELSGYDPDGYEGLIGVFAGASMSSYLFILYSQKKLPVGPLTISISNDKDYLPTRTSYKLNLKGPSVAVQTACSTSLVAVHQACQSLLNYQCDIALTGGASISLPPTSGYIYYEGGIDSPDGHCRAFDAKAAGTVSGSGVGVVALKRLAEALADGDDIHAVIKSSAINNDGAMKVGYMAPSIEGQAAVISLAHAVAEVDPATITYVEAHGTGTYLGDPIEVSALTQAFREGGASGKNFCAIGTVKTNIGHADAAAGVAGLLKTVLALKHRALPPSLHFERPNPQIDFADSPFFVNNTLTEWESGKLPRRAGVSSFGIGGTNAHVILEEAPAAAASGPSRPAQLLLLSARTQTALEAATANLANFFADHPDMNLADAAFTLKVGRKALERRRALVCRTSEEALTALRNPHSAAVRTSIRAIKDRPLAFMFPGQGAQYVNMGRGLYESEAVFREQVSQCAELLEPHLGLDLRRVLYPAPGQEEAAAESLAQTSLTQPALFVIEYALAQLWLSLGVWLQAMIGHSVGEYVAACLSGVFSLEDALRIVATRGRLMQQVPEGAMLAVRLPAEEAQKLSDNKLSIAAINSPHMLVFSGPGERVAALQRELEDQEVGCRRLRTSRAFHSSMMEPILETFIEYLKGVELSPPQIPYLSNLTGTWITAAEATDYSYWAKHLRCTVLFAEGLRKLLGEPDRALLEVGPGRTLSGLVADFSGETDDRQVIASMRHPTAKDSDDAYWLGAVGQLWLAGVDLDWKAFYADESRRRISLPTYPFERKRFWIEPLKAEKDAGPHASRPAQAGPWLSQEPATPLPEVSPAQAHAGNGSVLRETNESALEQVIAHQNQMMAEQIRLQSHLLSKQLEILKGGIKGA
ncbi:MAG TPA: type I polyketide synthase [Blastocatellia bacterium]|nr:type I polyketide synthase [Blastocatellia bacterium]